MGRAIMVVEKTLDLVILGLLKREPMHGYRLMSEAASLSPAVMTINAGTIYPLLARMTDKGLITGKWAKVGPKRKRQYYTITAKGIKHLAKSQKSWFDWTRAVNKFIRATA